MAMAGRKPKPTALKVLEGDRGKGRRPLNEHEPIPPRGGVKCPSWLLPEAKKEWKRLAASLEAEEELSDLLQPAAPRARAPAQTRQSALVMLRFKRIPPVGMPGSPGSAQIKHALL